MRPPRTRKKAPPRPSRKTPVAIVRRILESYARRGVFRSFSQTSSGGKAHFRFRWLWNLPFRATFQGKALRFENLLPAIPPGSELHAGLQAFIEGCQSDQRPEHRRIDPRRLAVQFSNRRLCFRVVGTDYEYGVRKAIHLVNEIFLSYLSAEHPQFLVRHFAVPEE